MKPFICYSARIATQLKKQGFKVLRSEINWKFPHLYVFLFENTPEFREAFAALQKETRNVK